MLQLDVKDFRQQNNIKDNIIDYSIIKDDILQQSMSKSLEVYHFMNDLQHLKTFPGVCQKNRP